MTSAGVRAASSASSWASAATAAKREAASAPAPLVDVGVDAREGAKDRGLIAYGRISTRTWEAEDGGRRKSVDLIADEWHFAERRPASSSPEE